jgi:hypothetical protein
VYRVGTTLMKYWKSPVPGTCWQYRTAKGEEVRRESRRRGSIVTVVERVGRHGGVGVPEGEAVDRVRDVEARRLCGDELVDVRPVPHKALSKGHVEVTRHFVHDHRARDTAALAGLHVGEGVPPVLQALLGRPEDHRVGPALGVVSHLEFVAAVATFPRLRLGSVARAACIGGHRGGYVNDVLRR